MFLKYFNSQVFLVTKTDAKNSSGSTILQPTRTRVFSRMRTQLFRGGVCAGSPMENKNVRRYGTYMQVYGSRRGKVSTD